MNPIDVSIESQLSIAMDNLRLCVRVCDFLEKGQGRPIETVLSVGRRECPEFEISGMNSGFVTTPIIHCAILDIRKLVPFLGMEYSQKDDALKGLRKKGRPDDNWIGDLGLTPVTPDQLDDLAQKICGISVLNILRGPLIYSNKQLAHFTNVEKFPEFSDIRNSCSLMVRAVTYFVYDALSLPHPRMHFQYLG